MILTCFALKVKPIILFTLIFIILLSDTSDLSPQGWPFSVVSIKTAAGCRQLPLNPAAALHCLPHSDVKSPKPPHRACSDKPACGSLDGSLALNWTWKDEKRQEQWEAMELRYLAVWGKANSCFITRPTHKLTPTHKNTYRPTNTYWL